MTKADDFNAKQLTSGQLTVSHISEMTRFWQSCHSGLEVDGMAGSNTIKSIESSMRPMAWLRSPLPELSDGRKAVVTSAFRPVDRPNHNGIDLFYKWMPGDKPDFVGDKGCAGMIDGHPKWVVPHGTPAVAAAPGRVQLVGGTGTGWRVWIDHGNGLRTGYFHLLDARVKEGDVVEAGSWLGMVGDNPSDNDGRHLHFELSPVNGYEPMDPVPFMKP